MAAYQPLNLPHGMGLVRGLDSLQEGMGRAGEQISNALTEARAAERQRGRDRFEKWLSMMGLKRQQDADARAVREEERIRRTEEAELLSKASELYRQGRKAEANTLLESYGLRVLPPDEPAAPEPEAIGRDRRPLGGEQSAADFGAPPSPSLDLRYTPRVGSLLADAQERGSSNPYRDAARQLGKPATETVPGEFLDEVEGIYRAENPLLAAAAADRARRAERDAKRVAALTTWGVMPPGPSPIGLAETGGGGPTLAADTGETRAPVRIADARGRVFTIDPHEGERYQQEQTQKRLARMDEAMEQISDELVKKYYPRIRAGVAAGLIAPEKAFDAMTDMAKADADRQARAETAKRPRGRVGGGTGAGGGVPKADKEAWEGARKVAADVFRQLDFKGSEAQLSKYSTMLSSLERGNAALDAATAGQWTKLAQGGTGVISDSDMRVFWQRIGGLGVRSADMLEGVLTGKISHPKRAEVMDAVRALGGSARERLNEIKGSLQFALENSPYARYTDQVLGTYFPGERSRIRDERAIDRAKQGRTQAPGRGKDALDADLERL